MDINADLRRRVVVDSGDLPWLPSPAHGIERRMLERDGEEAARATSVVRYLPHARFAEHMHGLGEEIFVLEGEFIDEYGRYPAGTWIKNPPGSSHAPYTESGCVLLVKLRHLDPEDQERQVVNTLTGRWVPTRSPGVATLPLGRYGETLTELIRFAAGSAYTVHSHPGGEEIFVLEGSFEDEQGHYSTGTWLRNPPGTTHLPFSPLGCVLYVKTGHLAALAAREAL